MSGNRFVFVVRHGPHLSSVRDLELLILSILMNCSVAQLQRQRYVYNRHLPSNGQTPVHVCLYANTLHINRIKEECTMLDPVFAINENSLRPLFGKAVCVILNDETRHTGILTSCDPSSIILNGDRKERAEIKERSQRPVERSRKSKLQADVSTIKQDDQVPPGSAFWGTLSISPAMDVSKTKAVIPLAPIRAVLPL